MVARMGEKATDLRGCVKGADVECCWGRDGGVQLRRQGARLVDQAVGGQ